MIEQLVSVNVWMLLVIMTRVGTMMALIPGFGSSYVLPRYRLGLALLLSAVMLPTVERFIPELPDSAMLLFLILAGEVIVGAFFASIGIVMLSALQAAGTFIAFFASMANALVQDAVAQQQSSVVSGFLTTSALVLIFVSDMHHLMLRALVDSYAFFVPGQPLLFGDLSDTIARRVTEAFALGLKISSPMLMVVIVYYVALGVLGRLMPTLQVFFFGLPVQITVQIYVLMLTFSGSMLVFLQAYSDAYAPFLFQ